MSDTWPPSGLTTSSKEDSVAEKKPATRTRSAKSGEFVTPAEAKADPAETVTEKVAPKRAAKPKAAEEFSEPKFDASAFPPREEMTQGELQLFKAAEEEARTAARAAEAKS